MTTLDTDYIARHVDGFDKLKPRALDWPPERVAQTCSCGTVRIGCMPASSALFLPITSSQPFRAEASLR